MSPAQRAWLEARFQEHMRRRAEYAAAQAAERLPLAREIIEALIESLKTDPAFHAAGQRRKR